MPYEESILTALGGFVAEERIISIHCGLFGEPDWEQRIGSAINKEARGGVSEKTYGFLEEIGPCAGQDQGTRHLVQVVVGR